MCSWIGYDGRGYRGKQALFLKGEYEENTQHNTPFTGFFASNGGISALRKIQIVCINNGITSNYQDNDETHLSIISAYTLFL